MKKKKAIENIIRDNRPKDDIITLNGKKYKRIEQ